MAYEFGKFEWGLRNVEGLIVLPLVRKAVQSLTLENMRSLDSPCQILYAFYIQQVMQWLIISRPDKGQWRVHWGTDFASNAWEAVWYQCKLIISPSFGQLWKLRWCHTQNALKVIVVVIRKKSMNSDYMFYGGIAFCTVHVFKRNLLNWIQEELFCNNPKQTKFIAL